MMGAVAAVAVMGAVVAKGRESISDDTRVVAHFKRVSAAAASAAGSGCGAVGGSVDPRGLALVAHSQPVKPSHLQKDRVRVRQAKPPRQG